MRRGWGTGSAEHILLPLETALVDLQCNILGRDQGVLDRFDHLGREHGLRGYRARYWLLPGLQHLVHLPPGWVVDFGVGAHEDGVELGPKVQGVWCRDILDHRVEHVEGR